MLNIKQIKDKRHGITCFGRDVFLSPVHLQVEVENGPVAEQSIDANLQHQHDTRQKSLQRSWNKTLFSC